MVEQRRRNRICRLRPRPHDFVDAVSQGGSVQIDSRLALHVVEILDAAYRSARGAGAVSVAGVD